MINQGSGPNDPAGDSLEVAFGKIKSGNFLDPASNLILPKSSGVGLQVDQATPSFGWRDLIGNIVVAGQWNTDVQRLDVPISEAFRGTYSRAYAFAAGNKIDILNFHLPHDYLPGSDLFIHAHWGHNGTAISGNFVIDLFATYAKRDVGIFNAEIDLPMTIACNLVANPQWGHNVFEIPLSVIGGAGGTLLDTSLLEVDGLIQIGLVSTAIPTITGGAGSNLPFIFTCDIHYQSTNMATKGRAPNFYV